MLGKIEGQKEKGATENEMVRYNQQLNGYKFEQTPGDSEGQEAWHAAVHGVTKSRTRHSDSTITQSSILFDCIYMKF